MTMEMITDNNLQEAQCKCCTCFDRMITEDEKEKKNTKDIIPD